MILPQFFLMKHMKLCLSGNKPKCDLCNKTFNHNDSLVRHVKMNHENQIPSWYSKGSEKIECQQCGKKISRWRMELHLKSHKKDPEKKNCDFCSKLLPSLDSLRDHVEIQHEDKAKCVF